MAIREKQEHQEKRASKELLENPDHQDLLASRDCVVKQVQWVYLEIKVHLVN